MPYAIIFYDDPDKAEVRARLRPAHIDYMSQNKSRLLASGGFLSDDGSEAFGGLIVLDTDSRDEAEQFVKQDPFWLGKLFSSYTIARWRKAFFAFENKLDPPG